MVSWCSFRLICCVAYGFWQVDYGTMGWHPWSRMFMNKVSWKQSRFLKLSVSKVVLCLIAIPKISIHSISFINFTFDIFIGLYFPVWLSCRCYSVCKNRRDNTSAWTDSRHCCNHKGGHPMQRDRRSKSDTNGDVWTWPLRPYLLRQVFTRRVGRFIIQRREDTRVFVQDSSCCLVPIGPMAPREEKPREIKIPFSKPDVWKKLEVYSWFLK